MVLPRKVFLFRVKQTDVVEIVFFLPPGPHDRPGRPFFPPMLRGAAEGGRKRGSSFELPTVEEMEGNERLSLLRHHRR